MNHVGKETGSEVTIRSGAAIGNVHQVQQCYEVECNIVSIS